MADLTVLEQSPRNLPRKQARNGGRPPIITHHHADLIAAKVAKGIPIHLALSNVHREFTLPHWNESITRDTILARHYQQKLGEYVEKIVDMLPGRTMRELPAEIWGLSRGVLRDHFVEGKSGGNQGNTFNNCNVQVNVQTKSAVRALLRKVTAPPKA